MRIGRDYAFDMILKVGSDIANNADRQGVPKRKSANGTRSLQSLCADKLWGLQKALSFRDITAREVLVQLWELAEHNPLVSPEIKEVLQEVVVEAA